MNQEVKNVFTPGPIVPYRSARKISSYLVRGKLYPLERKVSSEKCGKSRCEVSLNIQETDTFASTTTGESFKINHKLNCDDNCLFFLLICKCCRKQYVGETTDESNLDGFPYFLIINLLFYVTNLYFMCYFYIIC